jgi:hypothetical protein
LTLPTVSELDAMLRRYFVGATPAHSTALLVDLEKVLGDPARYAGEAGAFDPANGGKCYGQAWREELAYDRRRPNELELAAWLAATSEGYPAPRPYCPDVFVGTWRQTAPAVEPPPRWELALDGAFKTDERMLGSRETWCVHRQGHESFIGDAIWLSDSMRAGHRILAVLGITLDSLELHASGARSSYRLVRS